MEKKFVYTTAIKKIQKMKKRIKVIPGGSSAGKTYAILPILADIAIKKDGISISVVSESLPHLRRGAMRDFLNIMKMTGRYIDKNWNRTNSIYTFSNGSYIEFFPADNDDKLRGPRRNILYINECNRITEEAYTQLETRTDEDIFLDYNPSHKFWVDNIVKGNDDAEVLTLTYKDNEALSKNIIKGFQHKLKMAETSDYWKNWCDVYVYGKPGVLEGVIFNNWTTIDSIPEEARLIGYGMDFGFTNDPSTLIEGWYWNDSVIFNEVIFKKGLSNLEISKLITDAGVTGEIYADSADPKSIDELKKYGHLIFPTTKGPDSIIHGIDLLQSKNLVITSKSRNLIDELNRYSWKKDKNTGESLNIPIDNWNHGIDAMRYLALIKLGKEAKMDWGFYNIDF